MVTRSESNTKKKERAAANGLQRVTRDTAARDGRGPQTNVAEIITLERDAIAARTFGERISDAIARQAGRTWFIGLHATWFALWILLNTGRIPAVHPFDPYPYQFLTFVVSLEAIFLSLFILMSENRASRQADTRSHLDLQINLLAEQEATKMLQMLQCLCAYHKLPIAHDPEIEILKSPTKPPELAEELKANLPESC